ncbi:MAG: VOC family protein [Polyangiales bacterium]
MALEKLAIKSVTSVLVVDAIEPALALWEGKLGFTRVAEVPHEKALGFVILARDSVQVMLQTRASLAADLPAVAAHQPTSVLYVDVEALGPAAKAIEGAEVLVPERKTFYGAREIWVRDPQGQIVGLSEHHR